MHRERKCADTIGTVPILWAGHWKQHSETVIVLNYQNADYSLRKKFIVSFIIIFGTLSFLIRRQQDRGDG